MPVPQDGVSETGVSVAFTVRAMDAGPVLAQERVTVDEHIQAPELLADLFSRGTALLLSQLPEVWRGRAAQLAIPQVTIDQLHLFSCIVGIVCSIVCCF